MFEPKGEVTKLPEFPRLLAGLKIEVTTVDLRTIWCNALAIGVLRVCAAIRFCLSDPNVYNRRQQPLVQYCTTVASLPDSVPQLTPEHERSARAQYGSA